MEFNDDISKFADAFGDQLGDMVFAVTGNVSCLIAAFVIGWQIAAVICSTSPVIAMGIIFMMQAIDTMMNETQGWHFMAAIVVEDCLAGVHTVAAFGKERFEHDHRGSCDSHGSLDMKTVRMGENLDVPRQLRQEVRVPQ